MRRSVLFGHRGTWTRVHALRWFGAAALTGTLASCNFSDFTKTKKGEEACTEPLTLPNTLPVPVARFTFDNGSDPSGRWLDSLGAWPLTPKSDGPETNLPTFSASRLFGSGQAISLDGHQFAVYVGAETDALFANEFTISAWLTLPAGGITGSVPEVWPIVSTLDDEGCGGYQLDLRIDDEATGPELVFSYHYSQSEDAGAPCSTHALAYPIDNSPWAWGTGRWHQVAASYGRAGNGAAGLALHWDGTQLNPGANGVASGAISYTSHDLYVGANLASSASTAPKFRGTIDELALFDTALDAETLRYYTAATTTRPGPSGCRWIAFEQSDDYSRADAGTQTTWSSASAVQVDIIDNDWGAGFVSAQLSPARDLNDVSSVHLQATLPIVQATLPPDLVDATFNYQFSLTHGNDYCTWLLRPNVSGEYDIDLAHPSSCQSSTCQFPLTGIDWAKIATDWKHAALNPVRLEVRGIEFRSSGDKLDPATYGGAIGPGGWCWRPAGYELDASARFEGTPSKESVTATLTGPINSSSRITADFGSRVLDLTDCWTVKITGQFPSLTDPFTFALQDIHGAWKNWDIHPILGAATAYRITLNDFRSSISDDHDANPEYQKFPSFMIDAVNQISIQKPWRYQGSTTIQVSDIQLFGESGQPGCEIWRQR